MGYKLYDLTTPFDTKTPIWPHVGDPDIEYPRITRTSAACGKGAKGYIPVKQAARFMGVLHMGTHIDAPIHAVDRGKTVGQIPLEKCYGTGVVVDMRHKKKWDNITAEDFENAKPKIEEDDFVVVNTGWHKWWYVKDYIYFNHYPGLVPSGAEWLVKHKVKAIAGTPGELLTIPVLMPRYSSFSHGCMMNISGKPESTPTRNILSMNHAMPYS